MLPPNTKYDEEEKIDNITVNTILDIFYTDLFKDKIGTITIDYEKLGSSLGLTKEICKNIKAEKDYASINVFYNNERIRQIPKLVEFINSKGEIKKYLFYTKNFCKNLVAEKKCKNPIIILNETEIKEFSYIDNLFNSPYTKFKIMDKSMPKYEELFNQKEEDNNKIKFVSSNNLKYYCKSTDFEFEFYYSKKRTEFIDFNENEKVISICGNFGIGKSSSFLFAKTKYKNLLYLNLKALFENYDNIVIWKYELILLEVCSCFKYITTYSVFEEFKNIIQKKAIIWEVIQDIIQFIIDKKIKVKVILDQYKEQLDKSFSEIQKLINLVKNDKLNSINLIISSSLNNKDVRKFMLKVWFPEKYQNISLLFNYYYYYSLFDSKKIIDNDLSLTSKQRDLIANYFNYIPIFYFEIKLLKDSELDEYKKNEFKKIKINIINFEKENMLTVERIVSLVKYRPRFGTCFTEDELSELLEILPLKYFIKDNQIVSFYYYLVEQVFDDFMTEKICNFLSNPLSLIKKSTIGDLLELNFLIDLKKNTFQKFDQVINVDSIWNLKEISSNNNNSKDKCLLILQTDQYAPYFDFGILNKEESLILIQCKKALNAAPNSFPTKLFIYENKEIISEKIKTKFHTKVKNIYLLYITGISFIVNNENKIGRPWGNKNENFKILERICSCGQCLLLYYDIIEKKIYFKKDDIYEEIFNLVDFIKLAEPVKVNIDFDKLTDIEKNKYLLEIKYYKESQNLKERFSKYRPKNKNEVFLSMENIASFAKYGYFIKNNIIGVCDDPKEIDILHENLFIGFKTKRKKYLTIQETNKKRKIFEINSNEIKELNEKDFASCIFGNKIDKCYFFNYNEKEN